MILFCFCCEAALFINYVVFLLSIKCLTFSFSHCCLSFVSCLSYIPVVHLLFLVDFPHYCLSVLSHCLLLSHFFCLCCSFLMFLRFFFFQSCILNSISVVLHCSVTVRSIIIFHCYLSLLSVIVEFRDSHCHLTVSLCHIHKFSPPAVSLTSLLCHVFHCCHCLSAFSYRRRSLLYLTQFYRTVNVNLPFAVKYG